MIRYVLIAGLAGLLSLSTPAESASLDPADMRGLRNGPVTSGSTLLLEFSAVKSTTEDRTIAHFDISSLPSFTGATLSLSTQDQDGASPGSSSIDIYSFAGDGVVSIDEFGLGTLLEEVTGITGGSPTITVDITTVLMNAVTNGDSYLSFNLRNKDGDRGRFFLGHVIDGVFGSGSSAAQSSIVLTGTPAVPLPAGAVLLLSGLIGFGIARRRRT